MNEEYIEVLQEETVVNPKTGKGFAIAAFVLVFVVMFASIIAGIAIFGETILQFLLASILGAIITIFLMAIFFVTIVFVFGVYIVESVGFWPATAVVEMFKSLFGNIQITNTQLSGYAICQGIFIVTLILVLVFVGIALRKVKKIKKINPEIRSGGTKSFATIALIFGIIGLIICIGLFTLLIFLSL